MTTSALRYICQTLYDINKLFDNTPISTTRSVNTDVDGFNQQIHQHNEASVITADDKNMDTGEVKLSEDISIN